MLELEHVTKVYSRGFLRHQKTVALHDVSLSVRKGETLGLVGESGSGKSTLWRIALRLEQPSSGTVHFDGTDLTALSRAGMRRFRPRMQILFQDPDTSLDPRMTVAKSIMEPMEIWGPSGRAEREERMYSLLGQVGLTPDLAGRYPFEISGGQRQRIMLARVLSLSPEFLVADEPTSALDLSVQAQVIALIRELRARTGMTLLFISHDLEIIRQVSDRVGVLHEGRLVELRPTEDLFNAPEHPYTAGLVAASQEADVWFGKD
jgi:ABC-type glutathione transport system ATPase component